MVNKNVVTKIIKTYLPQAENAFVENIASDIIQDAENIIRSLIRHAVAQKKEEDWMKRN